MKGSSAEFRARDGGGGAGIGIVVEVGQRSAFHTKSMAVFAAKQFRRFITGWATYSASFGRAICHSAAW